MPIEPNTSEWVPPPRVPKAVAKDQRLYDRGYDNGFAAGQAERDELRAEVERLTLADRQWADHVKRQTDEREQHQAEFQAEIQQLHREIKRLRAALSEMLESFTEPEDDNDILRRARAALARPKEC